MSENVMYCVRCRRVVFVEKGAELFRTGFFRHDIPLGVCPACVAENKGEKGKRHDESMIL